MKVCEGGGGVRVGSGGGLGLLVAELVAVIVDVVVREGVADGVAVPVDVALGVSVTVGVGVSDGVRVNVLVEVGVALAGSRVRVALGVAEASRAISVGVRAKLGGAVGVAGWGSPPQALRISSAAGRINPQRRQSTKRMVSMMTSIV